MFFTASLTSSAARRALLPPIGTWRRCASSIAHGVFVAPVLAK